MMKDYLEIIGRSLIVYVFIIVAIRLSGKKELSQLSVIDLTLIMLISDSVQNAMVGDDFSLSGGLVAGATLFFLNYVLKIVGYKYNFAKRLIEGSPVLLIHKGKLIEENMRKEKISLVELETAVREHGVSGIDEVDLAILEIDGSISLISKNYQVHSKKTRKNEN